MMHICRHDTSTVNAHCITIHYITIAKWSSPLAQQTMNQTMSQTFTNSNAWVYYMYMYHKLIYQAWLLVGMPNILKTLMVCLSHSKQCLTLK